MELIINLILTIICHIAQIGVMISHLLSPHHIVEVQKEDNIGMIIINLHNNKDNLHLLLHPQFIIIMATIWIVITSITEIIIITLETSKIEETLKEVMIIENLLRLLQISIMNKIKQSFKIINNSQTIIQI